MVKGVQRELPLLGVWGYPPPAIFLPPLLAPSFCHSRAGGNPVNNLSSLHPSSVIASVARQSRQSQGVTTHDYKKGILKAFNSTPYTAIVQIEGSLSVWLEDVPVNRGIPTAEMITGRNVAVIFLDPGNPDDAVVVAVWT